MAMAMLSVCSCVVLPQQVSAQTARYSTDSSLENTFNRGLNYFHAGDYANAYTYMKSAADAGHVKSFYFLGWMYDHGLGVTLSYETAFYYYRTAALRGDSDAQFSVGWFYQSGLAVPQSYSRAAEWYRKSADQGNFQAQFRLGYLYEFGLGTRNRIKKR